MLQLGINNTGQLVRHELRAFRLDIYLAGVDIGFAREIDLEESGFINDSNRRRKASSIKKDLISSAYIIGERGEKINLQTGLVEEVDETPLLDKIVTLQHEEVLRINEKLKYYNKDFDAIGTRPILKDDWLVRYHEISDDKDFQRWIKSINSGWQNRTPYIKYEMYKAQAYNWLNKEVMNFPYDGEEEEQIDWLEIELDRCNTNTLYALDKYLWLKDEGGSGRLKYHAWEPQKVLLFLFDCMLSFLVGKGRQIGFTSTIAGAMVMKAMYNKSIHVKYAAQKGKKSQEVLDDKLKFPIQEIEWYMKVSNSNWNGNEVIFGKSLGKGGKNSSGSKLEVSAPTADMVNAGTPSILALDEGGLMEEFGVIRQQNRATMYRYNKKTERMEIHRQMLGWGTGGNMKEGASAFKTEIEVAEEAFNDGDMTNLTIPLFFDAFARPGMTWEIYNKEKETAYSTKQVRGKEDPKIVFHYTFPLTREDMFLSSSATIIPMVEIDSHIRKCNNPPEGCRRVYGMFQPIYDTSHKYDEYSDVPYKIIGAEFIPASSDDVQSGSSIACAYILVDREEGWRNRYYKGTDPIDSESGHSNFASCVWDAKLKAPVAYIDFRVADYRFCYLQSLLLNLYYGFGNPIREMLEYNIGKGYLDYCEAKGFRRMFIQSSMLPDNLKIEGAQVGVSKKGHNAKFILQRFQTLLYVHADSIYFERFWRQCKTYVKKETPSGAERYAPFAKNFDRDDLLDSVNYSELAASCYEHMPIENKADVDKSKVARRLKMVNGRMSLVTVKV